MNDDELMDALSKVDGPSHEGMDLMLEAVKNLVADDEIFLPSRERSLVLTKLDEAQMWLARTPANTEV